MHFKLYRVLVRCIFIRKSFHRFFNHIHYGVFFKTRRRDAVFINRGEQQINRVIARVDDIISFIQNLMQQIQLLRIQGIIRMSCSLRFRDHGSHNINRRFQSAEWITHFMGNPRSERFGNRHFGLMRNLVTEKT
ncbi:CAI-1 autoinducer sensor kinase/phosphatase CqsS domain protein [Vibrio cholerae]|nr:CAI-1 autoinducer sensor kinase/phosphatase CqsS domain protein [Vibrio cholerae]